jgi:hypothetical protein
MDGCMVGWTYGWIDALNDGEMEGCRNGRMETSLDFIDKGRFG